MSNPLRSSSGKLEAFSPGQGESAPQAGGGGECEYHSTKIQRMKEKSHLTNRKELEGSRRRLRKYSTSAEAVLWNMLKGRQLDGRKFRRQYSLDNIIMDFFCVSENLCVELDGQDHFTEEGKLRDEKRDAFITKFGIRVIRFENKAVWNNADGVLQEIRRHFKKTDTSLIR